MSKPHVAISKADARKLAGPALEIAPGDVVTPVHDWKQASVVRYGAAQLVVGARYAVAKVFGGYSGAFVELVDGPGDKFPAHLFVKAP